MKRALLFLFVCFASYFLYSCSNLEKEIDLRLPEYENKVVVECYLEPGEQYRLLLTESVSYFEEPALPTIDSALVIITYNGIPDTLDFGIVPGIGTGKYYNYTSSTIVPADYSSEFFLEIKDRKGRVVTGRTTIPVPVQIDTVEFQYNEDSIAFPLTKFTDNTSIPNFYRYVVTRDSYVGEVLTDFILDDELITSSQIAIGSAYELEKNAYTIVSLFHLNKDYYEFLESVGAAIDANGNPFGQPATIKSNVKGGLGIFTGLSYDRFEAQVP